MSNKSKKAEKEYAKLEDKVLHMPKADDIKTDKKTKVKKMKQPANETDPVISDKNANDNKIKPVNLDKIKTKVKPIKKQPYSEGRLRRIAKSDDTFTADAYLPAKITVKKKRTSWKKRLFNMAVVLVLGITTGSILGSWYYKTALKPFDYSKYQESDFVDDINAILSEVTGIANMTDAQKQNWVSLAQANGKTPLDLSASQNFQLAEFTMSLASSYTALGYGMVETIATQTIFSGKKFDGNTYTFESVSAGIMSVASCASMQKDSKNVTSYGGSIKNLDVAAETCEVEWNGKPTTSSKQDFKDLNGNTPDKLNPYIISSKTILAENEVVIETIANENGTTSYKFTMKLDPVSSVLNYIKQVKQTSGLASYPEFSDVTYTVIMDEDWNLQRTEVVENYSIVYGPLKPGCRGTLNTNYEINIPVNLPV